MTALEWDKIGERFFETGIDRGVLFTTDGGAAPWNGLTGIAESTRQEVKAEWLDSVKYYERYVPTAYSAKLDAFTYPDVLDELTGSVRSGSGTYLYEQPALPFHLSYRTQVGNDIDPELGYKIHILYNVLALPSSSGAKTIGATLEATTFSWDLSATPVAIAGHRPTSHISLHSRQMNPTSLANVEARLYGTAGANPSLPSLSELLAISA